MSVDFATWALNQFHTHLAYANDTVTLRVIRLYIGQCCWLLLSENCEYL